MPQGTAGRPWAVVTLPGTIKRTLKSPTPGSVHKLRTTIRRLETFLASTAAEEENKKLLKQLARMRKAAGQVRDVDVHLGILQGFNRRGVSSNYAELKSYLKRRRSKRQEKLTDALEKQLKAGVIKRLKQIGAAEQLQRSVASVSLGDIKTEFLLKAAPAPDEAGLHLFRLTCKHLRYSAELAPVSHERDTVIAELKKVQDAIGAWHDVLTLRGTAEELLGTTRPIVSLLRTLAQSRLNEAHRTISKSVAAVRRTMEPASPRKTVRSHSTREAHQLAATA